MQAAAEREKIVNKLRTTQVYELINWLKANQPTFIKNAWPASEVARRASEALKFRVTDHNVRGVMGNPENDRDIVVAHTWPRSHASPKNLDELTGRVNLIAQVLAMTTTELGINLGALQGEWDTLVDQLLGS